MQAESAGRQSTQLLLRVLTALEHVKETQRVQCGILQSILRRMNERHEPSELPQEAALPLRTMDDFDAFEEMAKDRAFADAVVSCSHNLCYYGSK